MVEMSRLLYIVVVDEERRDGDEKGGAEASFHYTRAVLQSCLQLMGCKARHAFKMSRRVFQVMQSENSPAFSPQSQSSTDFPSNSETKNSNISDLGCPFQRENPVNTKHLERSKSVQFEMYKKLTTVVVPRETFLDVVCDTLSRYKYMGPNQRADLALACRCKERKESITVLLCGTSGCGKSTLSSLLGSRMGITTVISTDSIRHMMRSYTDAKQNPLLWASTYHAGECLDPVAVAEARAKRKAKKLAGVSKLEEASSRVSSKNQSGGTTPAPELISKKQIAIEGYKAQSEMVSDGIDRLITTWEERKESVIVEGVHLSLNFVMDLMKKHPSIIPFMIYISDEEKHTERFAVRAKYMALDPAKNKYVKYIRNIRTIQEYLCTRADKYLIPKINNTNVDKSVAAIHATVFSCLRRREANEALYDPVTKSVPIIYEEYRNQCLANSLSSKGMFQLIQRKGSFRHLMALVNTDGSVAKAWPVNSVDTNGGEKCVGSPMTGPLLQISKAEPVNLQFGSFGISAFPSDTGCTSHNGSVEELCFDDTHSCSRCHSSSCSSPRMSKEPAMELKEDFSVSDSDEEIDDHQFVDTDDEISEVRSKDVLQESEGSVDEESSESDEEYEDLTMRDVLEKGYWSDDDDPYKANKLLKTPNKEEDPEEILPLGPFSSISLMEYVTPKNMYDFRVTQIRSKNIRM